jgi:hypothetical protein
MVKFALTFLFFPFALVACGQVIAASIDQFRYSDCLTDY